MTIRTSTNLPTDNLPSVADADLGRAPGPFGTSTVPQTPRAAAYRTQLADASSDTLTDAGRATVLKDPPLASADKIAAAQSFVDAHIKALASLAGKTWQEQQILASMLKPIFGEAAELKLHASVTYLGTSRLQVSLSDGDGKHHGQLDLKQGADHKWQVYGLKTKEYFEASRANAPTVAAEIERLSGVKSPEKWYSLGKIEDVAKNPEVLRFAARAAGYGDAKDLTLDASPDMNLTNNSLAIVEKGSGVRLALIRSDGRIEHYAEGIERLQQKR